MSKVIEPWKFYTARTLRPGGLDLDTPISNVVPDPGSLSTNNPHLANDYEPRTIVFTEYDENSHLGSAYIVSSLTHENDCLHRWVALTHAQPKPGQPPFQIVPEPADFFKARPVYINYAFKLKVRVHQPVPASRMPKETCPFQLYDPAPSMDTRNDGRIPPSSAQLLEDLHAWFWVSRSLGVPPPGPERGADPENPVDGARSREGAGSGEGGSGGNGIEGVSSGLRIITKSFASDKPLSVTPDTTILKLLKDVAHNTDGIWSSKHRRESGKTEPCSGSEDEGDDEESDSEELPVEKIEDGDARELLKLFRPNVEGCASRSRTPCGNCIIILH